MQCTCTVEVTDAMMRESNLKEPYSLFCLSCQQKAADVMIKSMENEKEAA